jgi:hypothetical protein
MFKALLDNDGVQREELIEDTEGFVVKTTQDVDPILARNARMRQHQQTGNVRHVASIPVILWDRWMKETAGAIMHDPVLLKEKLNSPEFQLLRTSEGKL